MNPQRNEWDLLSPNIMKTTLQAKDLLRISLQLCTQIHPDVTSENSGCKSSGGQGMEKARDNPSMEFGESQEQKGGYSGSTKRQKKVHFATLMDTRHLKNAELGIFLLFRLTSSPLRRSFWSPPSSPKNVIEFFPSIPLNPSSIPLFNLSSTLPPPLNPQNRPNLKKNLMPPTGCAQLTCSKRPLGRSECSPSSSALLRRLLYAVLHFVSRHVPRISFLCVQASLLSSGVLWQRVLET